jgi:hypothetical protein
MRTIALAWTMPRSWTTTIRRELNSRAIRRVRISPKTVWKTGGQRIERPEEEVDHARDETIERDQDDDAVAGEPPGLR